MTQTLPSRAVRNEPASLTGLERWLRPSRAAQAADPVVVFAVALAAITIALPFAGPNPLARQSVVCVTDVLMLGVVWLGRADRLHGSGAGHLLRDAQKQSVGARGMWTNCVLPSLAGAATILLASAQAGVLGGGPSAPTLTAAALLLAPTFFGITSFCSMNAFDFMFWIRCRARAPEQPRRPVLNSPKPERTA
jgi:hypothetical protein